MTLTRLQINPHVFFFCKASWHAAWKWQNNHTNTIIIVHLATLVQLNHCRRSGHNVKRASVKPQMMENWKHDGTYIFFSCINLPQQIWCFRLPQLFCLSSGAKASVMCFIYFQFPLLFVAFCFYLYVVFIKSIFEIFKYFCSLWHIIFYNLKKKQLVNGHALS